MDSDHESAWIDGMRRKRRRLLLGTGGVAACMLLGVGALSRGATSHPAAAATLQRAQAEASVPTPPPEPASTDDPEPAEATRGVAIEHHGPPDPRTEPASRPGRELLALKDAVFSSLTHTAYEHRTRIDRDEGIYVWDCSAMAAWMLRRVAPRARRSMGKPRPVARDFHRWIAQAPTHRARGGRRKITNIEEVRPGDMFAWERPPNFPSPNTGHVGFVLEPPRPAPRWPGGYTVRIVDATSLPHQDDTRSDPEGGIGEGTILFLADAQGRAYAYGWFGDRSPNVVVTDIGFARLSG